MNILITNDDGYRSKGVKVLAEIMKHFGEVTVIAPVEVQSGMSMAVSLGAPSIAFTSIEPRVEGTRWFSLDATPATCAKFAINNFDVLPDIVVSGINHGSNAATASCYSGTLGAAEEAVLNGIPAIGVSIDSFDPDADLSWIERRFPEIFTTLVENWPKDQFGIYYNVNFPPCEPKGIKVSSMGLCRWIHEFAPNDDGTWHMRGEIEDIPGNTPISDHHLLREGWITITPHRLDSTDYREVERLTGIL